MDAQDEKIIEELDEWSAFAKEYFNEWVFIRGKVLTLKANLSNATFPEQVLIANEKLAGIRIKLEENGKKIDHLNKKLDLILIEAQRHKAK